MDKVKEIKELLIDIFDTYIADTSDEEISKKHIWELIESFIDLVYYQIHSNKVKPHYYDCKCIIHR